MLTVKDKAAIAGVAELRTDAPRLLRELKKHHVILTRRNKPAGVLVDYDAFEQMKATIEELEDTLLGFIAGERRGRKGRKTITLDEAEKKVRLR